MWVDNDIHRFQFPVLLKNTSNKTEQAILLTREAQERWVTDPKGSSNIRKEVVNNPSNPIIMGNAGQRKNVNQLRQI